MESSLRSNVADDCNQLRRRLAQYHAENKVDKAWRITRALAFSEQATEKETAFFKRFKPDRIVLATQRMTELTWHRIQCTDRSLGAIFAAIHTPAGLSHAHPHKAFGLRYKDRRNIEPDPLQFPKALLYTTEVLGVRRPDVYLQPELKGTLAVANTHKKKNKLMPSYVVYEQLLRSRNEKELTFALAQQLTFMRPAYYVEQYIPSTTSRQAVLYAAMTIIIPSCSARGLKRTRSELPS